MNPHSSEMVAYSRLVYLSFILIRVTVGTQHLVSRRREHWT
jgi:hypothetical protein